MCSLNVGNNNCINYIPHYISSSANYQIISVILSFLSNRVICLGLKQARYHGQTNNWQIPGITVFKRRKKDAAPICGWPFPVQKCIWEILALLCSGCSKYWGQRYYTLLYNTLFAKGLLYVNWLPWVIYSQYIIACHENKKCWLVCSEVVCMW